MKVLRPWKSNTTSKSLVRGSFLRTGYYLGLSWERPNSRGLDIQRIERIEAAVAEVGSHISFVAVNGHLGRWRFSLDSAIADLGYERCDADGKCRTLPKPAPYEMTIDEVAAFVRMTPDLLERVVNTFAALGISGISRRLESLPASTSPMPGPTLVDVGRVRIVLSSAHFLGWSSELGLEYDPQRSRVTRQVVTEVNSRVPLRDDWYLFREASVSE